MRGKILEYEAKTIRNDERKKVTEELTAKFKTETEEMAKAMLRDRMELSRIEKYTHLTMPRIQELARSLGMA